ncbi:MAG: hypothetical protein ACFFEF_06340 [Candidatus Thorarchaeota archaeon]
MSKNVKNIAIIGPVVLLISGISPVINGISAWYFANPSFTGCTYDGCTPSTAFLYMVQIMVGFFGLVLGASILKGNGENSIGALWTGASGLLFIILYELNLPLNYSMLLSAYIPNPFYFMIWVNEVLLLAGASVAYIFWKDKLSRNSQAT